MGPQRITPEEARERVKAGNALFVCAYEDETRCKPNNLEGSMTFGEFKQRSGIQQCEGPRRGRRGLERGGVPLRVGEEGHSVM